MLGSRFTPEGTSWIAEVSDEVEAVTVFTRFSEHNCEMSIATNGKKRWATRGYLRACFRYPFVQCKKTRVTVVIEDDNVASIRLCRLLGYVDEGTLKGWFGPKDGVLMRMTFKECRWL